MSCRSMDISSGNKRERRNNLTSCTARRRKRTAVAAAAEKKRERERGEDERERNASEDFSSLQVCMTSGRISWEKKNSRTQFSQQNLASRL